jgi:type VI secretion system protein ImpG
MSAPYEVLTALFLEELSALDRFAAEREAEGRLLPAGREDPDVRRILEALAFFSARTRAAAAASTRAAVRRIAGATLDDLLPVAPAALLVAARPTEQLVEPVTVPAGAQLRVKAADGSLGLFTTELPFTVLPAEIEGAGLVEDHRTLSLRVQLRALRSFRSPRWVSVHVRRFNDYRASLALHDALARHTVRALAAVDGRAAVPCRVTFDATPPRRAEDETGEAGALARARVFFHMPDRDLFFHVEIAAPSWNRLAIQLELDAAFPTDLAIGNDSFHLAVTPASNVWADFADPILCDGTRDAYPIRHPSPLLPHVELHSVRGVYRGGEGGLVPILPAALSEEGDTYEVLDGEDGGSPELAPRVMRAFEKPPKLLVDARWSQPGLWSGATGKLAITPHTRHLPGASFAPLGPMRRAEPSPLARDPARALDLLALRMRPVLERRDLAAVLEILGTAADGPFQGAHGWIDALASSEEPDPSGGIRYRYVLSLRQRSAEDAPLVRRLLAQVSVLLQGWTEDSVRVDSTIVADARRRPLPAVALP